MTDLFPDNNWYVVVDMRVGTLCIWLQEWTGMGYRCWERDMCAVESVWEEVVLKYQSCEFLVYDRVVFILVWILRGCRSCRFFVNVILTLCKCSPFKNMFITHHSGYYWGLPSKTSGLVVIRGRTRIPQQ